MGENFFQNTYLILQTCIGNLTVVLEIVEFGTTHAQKETTYRTHRKHGRAEGLLADTREKERWLILYTWTTDPRRRRRLLIVHKESVGAQKETVCRNRESLLFLHKYDTDPARR